MQVNKDFINDVIEAVAESEKLKTRFKLLEKELNYLIDNNAVFLDTSQLKRVCTTYFGDHDETQEQTSESDSD